MRKAHGEKGCAKTAWGLRGFGDGVVDPVSIALIPAPGIPYDWSIVAVYFNTCLNHLPLRKHVEYVKPSYTAPFDILTRATVFRK